MSSAAAGCDAAGRYLLPDCKRSTNHEGLGSSLTFHRAAVAYAILYNLTLAAPPLVVGHGLGAGADAVLGLQLGGHCSRCGAYELKQLVANGTLREIAHVEPVDFVEADGGAELAAAARGKAAPGSFGALAEARRDERGVVFVLRGCPRLTSPLAGGLADEVELAMRRGFELALPMREAAAGRLPWAGRPAHELQLAVHYRAGDLFEMLGAKPAAAVAWTAAR